MNGVTNELWGLPWRGVFHEYVVLPLILLRLDTRTHSKSLEFVVENEWEEAEAKAEKNAVEQRTAFH